MRRVFLVVTVALGVAMTGRSYAASDSNLNLQMVIQNITSELHQNEAMDFMRRLYSLDHWSTFPKFQESAEYLEKSMNAIGLRQVELLSAPADGTSQFGYWTEPLAWDVKQGRLEIVDPALPEAQRTIADYQKVPCSVCMWSSSTPAKGVTAEVVDLKETRPEAIAKLDLRGKLVLTATNAANVKWALVKAGALGAINTFSENPNLLDGRQWVNAWGDNGWAFTKASTPMLCFSISPRGTKLVSQTPGRTRHSARQGHRRQPLLQRAVFLCHRGHPRRRPGRGLDPRPQCRTRR